MLVEALNPDRNFGHAPVFQVLFTFMSFPARSIELAGLTLETIDADTLTSRFDLTVEISTVEFGQHKGKFQARYDYDSDLFDKRTIERLHEHFEHLLAATATDPTCGVEDLPLLTREAERLLLDNCNAVAVEHDRTRCVHHLVEATARAMPNAPAVTAGHVTLSYHELDQRANQLAHFLYRRGVRPGVLVGICLDRTVDVPVCLAAVLKIGAAYLPLDPTHPEERLRYIVEDAGVACVITVRLFGAMFDGADTPSLLLDQERDAISTQPDTSPNVVVRPDDHA
jgi:non-ribosomal peptide synthetase component F